VSRQQRLTLIATILGSTVVFLDSTVIVGGVASGFGIENPRRARQT